VLATRSCEAARVRTSQSVEEAVEMADQAYMKQSDEFSHMSCLMTGSSYLVAEALALLKTSGT
jgi:hypothetical protein